MSSGQKSVSSYFKRKENAEESDNNSTKKSKINDNSNNIVNDSTTNIQTLSNTEPSCDIQSNINENCSLSTTIIITTNDNKKRTYQKRYSDSYKWLIFLCQRYPWRRGRGSIFSRTLKNCMNLVEFQCLQMKHPETK
jgi:hypothetical protein